MKHEEIRGKRIVLREQREEDAPFFDRILCCHTKLYNTVLYLFVIQMHHPYRAVPNTKGTDEIQQEAKAEAFQNKFDRKHMSSSLPINSNATGTGSI